MADISKLVLPSGDEYNIKDAYAREFIQTLEPDLDGETSTVTGDIVSFETKSAHILPSVVVDIDPVQAGSGDPSPDNVRPISGWDGCKVERVGKNLLPTTLDNIKSINTVGTWTGSAYVYNGITYTVFTDNTGNVVGIKANGTASGNSSILVANGINLNGTYILNGSIGGTASTYRINLYSSEGIVVLQNTNGDTQSTSLSGSNFRARIYISNGITVTNVMFYPMLRYAIDTNPSFEPYQNSTYSISFPSSAGTIYGGTLDVTNGVLMVTHGAKQVPTAKSQISAVSLSGETVSFWIYASGLVAGTSDDTPICDTLKNHQVGGASLLSLNEFSWSTVHLNSFFCRMSTTLVGTTQNSIWEYLQANPLTVCSQLSAPVTYQLTPKQVTALLGQNNLWADTGDSTIIYRTGKLALLSDVVGSEERVREDLNDKIDSLTATDVGAAKDSSIAPVEPTSTASEYHNAGELFMLDGNLYQAASTIAVGETIVPGTNAYPMKVIQYTDFVGESLWEEFQRKIDELQHNLPGIPYEGVDLTVKFADEISEYSDPWAWIKARITNGNWSGLRIGDYISFTTTESSPKTYQAQIAGINTYKNYGDTAVGNHIDFITRDVWATKRVMNPVDFNNGTKFGDAAATEFPWLASDLYLYLNSLSGKVPNATTVGGGTGTDVDYTSGGVYYYLPAALKAQIVEKRAYLPKRYSASEVLLDDNSGEWTNIGKIWLLTEWEVYGGPARGGLRDYAVMGNCVHYPIFLSMQTREKKLAGSRVNWWLLSTTSDSSQMWCGFHNRGLANRFVASNSQVYFPVCFRIA